MAFSLTPSEYSVRWEGLTLRWYQAVWQNQHIQEALLVSLMVTIPAVLMATAIGTLTALALYRARFPGKALLQGLLYIPLIMPSLVIGIALLLFFVAITMPLGVLTIGVLSEQFGPPVAILIMAGLGIGGLSLIWAKLVGVRPKS